MGKNLENIVDFIFEKSVIYKVHSNKQSSTHEIDQFIVLSDEGIQLIEELKLSKELLITKQKYFLCECKNYKDKVPATWVGKFNTLLEVSGKCQVGILFSYKGLTGRENSWEDAHGLAKIIYYLGDNNSKRYIIDFNINDFELLNKNRNTSIIEIIKNKKIAVEIGISSQKLLEDKHDSYDNIATLFQELLIKN